MAHRQIVLFCLAAGLALLAACAPKSPPAPESEAKPQRVEPGHRLLLDREALARELGCDGQAQIVLEANALVPERAVPGGEVRHHIVYAYCPAKAGPEERGALTRRLTLKGKTVFVDRDERFVPMAGRASVDAYFQPPPTAPAGTYVLEVEYKSAIRPARGGKALSFGAKEILILEPAP